MGYTGKQVIHPDQVPIVQTTFLPNKKQIEWAIGLLAAFEEHQKNGKVRRQLYYTNKINVCFYFRVLLHIWEV